MSDRRARALALTLASAALGAGCDWTVFESFRHNTPVVTLVAPVDFPDVRFARGLAVLNGDAGDWVVSSGALGTPVVALPLFANNRIFPAVSPFYICGPGAPCTTDRTGAALAGITRWAGGTTCGMTGEFTTVHHVHGRCMGGAAAASTFDVMPPPGLEQAGFGLALATPRSRVANDPLAGDLLFVGAPAGVGHVVAAMPSGVTTLATPAGLAPEAAMGTALAAGRIRTNGVSDVLVVAGAPGMRAALVFRGDPRSGRPMTQVGCVVHGEEPGFGGVVGVADLDGDGSDDVAVSALDAMLGRLPRVHVYLTSTAPANNGCTATAWPETVAVDCAEVPGRGATCGGGGEGFGASLAGGDLDGDGRDELLVGSPHSDVEGVPEAGAVWVLRGSGSGASFRVTTADVLRNSSPINNGQLGANVLVERVGTRDEAIAGAGGAQRIEVFLCSGLDADRPSTGTLDTQCRPPSP